MVLNVSILLRLPIDLQDLVLNVAFLLGEAIFECLFYSNIPESAYIESKLCPSNMKHFVYRAYLTHRFICCQNRSSMCHICNV